LRAGEESFKTFTTDPASRERISEIHYAVLGITAELLLRAGKESFEAFTIFVIV
jgi:hypothetical protein